MHPCKNSNHQKLLYPFIERFFLLCFLLYPYSRGRTANKQNASRLCLLSIEHCYIKYSFTHLGIIQFLLPYIADYLMYF